MSSRLMPAKPGATAGHRPHDLVLVLGVQAQGPRVDAGEPLEQCRLPLHDRERGGRTDVAQAEHGGPSVTTATALRFTVRRARRRVVDDGAADAGDAGGVDQRQVVAVADGVLGLHLDDATEVHQEGAVGDLVDVDAGTARRAATMSSA
jgi:hypothetical protein